MPATLSRWIDTRSRSRSRYQFASVQQSRRVFEIRSHTERRVERSKELAWNPIVKCLLLTDTDSLFEDAGRHCPALAVERGKTATCSRAQSRPEICTNQELTGINATKRNDHETQTRHPARFSSTELNREKLRPDLNTLLCPGHHLGRLHDPTTTTTTRPSGRLVRSGFPAASAK